MYQLVTRVPIGYKGIKWYPFFLKIQKFVPLTFLRVVHKVLAHKYMLFWCIYTPWGGFLKNQLVRWTLFGKSVQQTLWERPLDATLVKRPLDNGSQSVQWALCVASAHCPLHGGVQWALTDRHPLDATIKHPVGASFRQRPLDAFKKRPTGASISKRPLDAFWVEWPVDTL
jgi:hypothetical protein